MEAIEQEQAADELVARCCFEQYSTGLAGLAHELKQAPESGSVQLENRVNELLGVGPGGVIGRIFKCLRQRFDSLDPLSETGVFGWMGHRGTPELENIGENAVSSGDQGILGIP